MNSEKFNKILDQHQQRIYSLALYILRDRSEAEDITQDVFTRLWKDFAHIDLDKTRQWLSTVTRNACIDKIRRRKEYTQVEDNHQITTIHQEPAGNLALNQLSDWLKNAISCLKEPYSSLIILCDVQQTPQDKAAQALDLSANQVKVYLHRARRQLRCLLKEHNNER
jgi:RNA polymerase sigma-70 factor (ECF subfamily)